MSVRKQFHLALAFTCVFFVTVCAFGRVVQDSYKSDPVDQAFVMPDPAKYDKSKKDEKLEFTNLEKAAKAARSSSKEIADNILRGSADLSSAKTEFDRYFTGLSFPSMTQTDDDSLFRLGTQRDELLNAIRDVANDSPVRKHLIEELTTSYFSRVAADAGYHPAVRLNAILIIGNLNRREGSRNVEPSLPMETALRILVNAANAADSPNYLKVGALSGILRHATIDGQMQTPVLDNALRQQCIDLAVSLIDSITPAESTPLSDEQYWIRRQAVQILGAFRAPGTDGKTVVALRKILDDKDTPIMLAADAIDAYGTMRFASAEQADVANSIKSVGRIVNKFFMADVKSIEDYISSIKDNQLIAKKSRETSSNQQGDATNEQEGFGLGTGTGRGSGRVKGAGGGSSAASAVQKVKVPNYKINDVRQRSKYIVFIARRALDGLAPKRKNEVRQPENLKKWAAGDPITTKAIEQIVAALDKVMEQTDLAPPKTPIITNPIVSLDEPKKPETNDERLRNSLNAGISAIETAIGVNAPVEQQPGIKSAIGG